MREIISIAPFARSALYGENPMSDTQQTHRRPRKSSDILLFRESNVSFPMCGLAVPSRSSRSAACNPEGGTTVNVLEDAIRQGALGDHSESVSPSREANGRVHRRSDIMMEMHCAGELKQVLDGQG